ncbi:hypothetical protein Cgig2_031656 [Carnegiea gigantea]|uniref:AB hydrolase-1 domain-containing protein n=1 Tax=Carnegiea gigantea TaxID=171969 RepID=A0A9Q1KS00_9CARY|nr:hypothetical protein Cgig2_031656 [Carnegiea gigantea]
MATLPIHPHIHVHIHSDMRSALQFSSSFLRPSAACLRRKLHPAPAPLLRVRAFSPDPNGVVQKVENKPPICTADELHYVNVASTDWRLALWRYHPHPQACRRNRPLLLLSGVGTNAIGYDLSPESSFARYMSGQGFDTWILEVRGAGLSMRATDSKVVEQSAHTISSHMEATAERAKQAVASTGESSDDEYATLVDSDAPVAKGDPRAVATMWDESQLVAKLTETFMHLSERLSGFLTEAQSGIMSAKLFDQLQKLFEDSQLLDHFDEIRGRLLTLLESNQNSSVGDEIRDLSQRLVNIFEEGHRSVSPQIFDFQERFFTTVEDFQKQLDLMVKYDWDFDHYLEEDVPAVMEYIRSQSKPKDDKLFAIGHSMGGILLYALLSRCEFEGRDPKLAAIVTLASSLDYTTSNSSLKMLLPLANPAQVLNVPVVPLGAMLSAAYPLSSSPPYVLSWLNNLISAEDMMDPELLKKLVLNNFCKYRHDFVLLHNFQFHMENSTFYLIPSSSPLSRAPSLRIVGQGDHILWPLHGACWREHGCCGTIPAKLILQLTTAFREGGLRDRSGTFFYKDHLRKSNVPVLALAGDQDLICPPEAVYETVKLIPDHLVTYKVFGQPGGPHYAHYDLVGGRLAVEQVYPCIVEFLSRYD